MKKEKEITNTQSIKNNIYALKLVWGMSKSRIIHSSVMFAFSNFQRLFFSAIFMRYIIAAIQKGKSFNEVFFFIAIMGSVFMIAAVHSVYTQNVIFPLTNITIYRDIYGILYNKARNTELSCFEDNEFYNKYTMAIDGAHDKVTSVVDNLCCIIFGSITCAGSFYAMFTIDAVAGLFVLFPVIGNFVVGPLLNKIYLKRYQESVPYYRKSDYVNRVIHLSDYAKEIRMSKVYGLMIKKYDNAVDGMGQVAKKHAKKGVPLYLLKHILSFTAIFEGALLYGAYRAMVTKSIDLPELAVLASLMTTAAFTMVNVVYNSFLELMKNGLFIQNIRTFLEYEEKIPENQEGIIPDKKIESIEFRNVYFAYKENDYIIKDLSFKVHGKNSIALVGHNGAGKSTIIKLLFRLYDPTKGDILLNGINIKEYNLKEYRLLFAAAFQDYKAMAYSVSDNVLMGRQIDNPGESVKTALKRAGVYNKITSLTKGVDTTLTKEFDEAGAVLSGGELQKIMVARAFANPAPIKVFDEPSSALDPIAEFDMFQSILEEMRENTVIFISHRLSSVKNAHTVLMLENGEIIERGTHNELIKQNGKYAVMYNMQAKNYLALENEEII